MVLSRPWQPNERARARRASASSSARRHRRSAPPEQAYRELDADGRFPAALRNAALKHAARAGRVHAAVARTRRAVPYGVDRLFVERQGSCGGRALAAPGPRRCRRRRRRRSAQQQPALRLSRSRPGGPQRRARPFDARRNGISIGEAAAFTLLRRGPGALQLLGYGESNDATTCRARTHKGWAPKRRSTMRSRAPGSRRARLAFVNLHGTASALNDEVEAALVARRYAAGVHACATKGLTGHTMGAAGALEAAICLLALERGLLAGSVGTQEPDPQFGAAFGARYSDRARATRDHDGGQPFVRLRRQTTACSSSARAARHEDAIRRCLRALATRGGRGAPGARPAGANERRRAPDFGARRATPWPKWRCARPVCPPPGWPASSRRRMATSRSSMRMCKTLADDPLLLSPTRFHHSVHNAASGYWAIG